MSGFVSIVIPTFHREDLLLRCLRAAATQSYSPLSYEILVADDAGSAATRDVVERFGMTCLPAVRYVVVGPAHGPAAARNAGWRAARGSIVAFTDDDCVPDRDWLLHGAETIQECDAVAGRVIVPLRENPTDYERDCAGLSHGEFVTANCFCRRSVLEAVKGFDERFTAAWREDSDLHFTMLEQGYSIKRDDRAIVVHPVRPASWGVSLSQQRKSLFNALLYRKHPELYRQRIPRKPTVYYAMAAALGLSIGAFLAGIRPVAAGSLLVWGGMVLHLFLQRIRDTNRNPRHIAEMIVTSAVIPLLSLYWHVRGLMKYGVLFR